MAVKSRIPWATGLTIGLGLGVGLTVGQEVGGNNRWVRLIVGMAAAMLTALLVMGAFTLVARLRRKEDS